MKYILLFLALVSLAIAATAEQVIQIQVRFTIERDGQRYADVLYFSQADFAALKAGELAAAQEARFQGWLAAVEAAKHVITPEPTKAELQARAVEMQALADDLQRRLTEVTEKIAIKEAAGELVVDPKTPAK